MANNSPSVVNDLSGKGSHILFIIGLLAIFSICACQSNHVSKQKLIDPPPLQRDIWVPRWYAEMPRIPGCHLAYAHSGVYLKADRQEQALLDNGAANLAKSNSVALEVGWAGSQISSHSQTAAYIKEKAWESRADNLKKNLKILKEFRLDQSMLALVGVCPGQEDTEALASVVDETLVNVSSKEPPTWVSSPLQSSGEFYGVGSAAGHTTAAKAWQEAERQARADLAMRLAAQNKVLEKNIDQNAYAQAQIISETYAKLTLQNLHVIRHAYSHTGRTYYALVRLPATSRK